MPNPLPKMLLVKQRFNASAPIELQQVLDQELARVRGRIQPGMRLAVAVGSRGITHLQGIVATVVAGLKQAGAAPFIIPAMGSHGGATPEGQTELPIAGMMK